MAERGTAVAWLTLAERPRCEGVACFSPGANEAHIDWSVGVVSGAAKSAMPVVDVGKEVASDNDFGTWADEAAVAAWTVFLSR